MARGEEISLPSFPFSPETLDTQARTDQNLSFSIHRKKFPTQGRGNSIGIPKNLYVCHFRCFPCLIRSPLEFLNPTPTLLNLKLLVSLKDLALE